MSAIESKAAMAQVARLYYVRGLTQQEIADRLGTSRFKVLRLLDQARAQRVVRFEIDEPVPVLDDLSRALEQRHDLALALVVEEDVAAATAQLLPQLLRSDEVLGVAWGATLSAIVAQLPPLDAKIPVVQICGAIAGLKPGAGPIELAARVAEATGGALHALAAPAVVSEEALADAIRPTVRMFDRVTTALVGIGTGTRAGAAGHVLTHVFDERGRLVSEEQAIALSVEQLRRTRVVAAAGGPAKGKAVAGALRTGLLNVLVTDEACARAALR